MSESVHSTPALPQLPAMKIFNTLVASSALTNSSPCFITKSVVEDPSHDGYRVPVTCSKQKPCPIGTTCYKIYGDTGFCVLLGSGEQNKKRSKVNVKFELTKEDKESFFEFTGVPYDSEQCIFPEDKDIL